MSRLLCAFLAASLAGGGLTAAAAPIALSTLEASAQSTVGPVVHHRIRRLDGDHRGSAIFAGTLSNPCHYSGCCRYYDAGYYGPSWGNGYNGGYAGGWGRGGGSYHGGGFHGGLRRGGIAGFHGGIRGGGLHDGGGFHGGGFNGGHL
ncbi:hypothetical protein [Rhodoblastus sp.]|uniref:hypothetical protein n=1 Tax=Rhodoblastus sp. TaxID=1962975 RepID=UPI0026127909|nr:hypothetical protein [Rhodoblastus sp.]